MGGGAVGMAEAWVARCRYGWEHAGNARHLFARQYHARNGHILSDGRHLFNQRHLFENSDIVRDKLLRVGFRSFADVELTSRMDGDGDDDTYMVVSGYKIGECLAWVGEGMTFDRHVWVGEYQRGSATLSRGSEFQVGG